MHHTKIPAAAVVAVVVAILAAFMASVTLGTMGAAMLFGATWKPWAYAGAGYVLLAYYALVYAGQRAENTGEIRIECDCGAALWGPYAHGWHHVFCPECRESFEVWDGERVIVGVDPAQDFPAAYTQDDLERACDDAVDAALEKAYREEGWP